MLQRERRRTSVVLLLGVVGVVLVVAVAWLRELDLSSPEKASAAARSESSVIAATGRGTNAQPGGDVEIPGQPPEVRDASEPLQPQTLRLPDGSEINSRYRETFDEEERGFNPEDLRAYLSYSADTLTKLADGGDPLAMWMMANFLAQDDPERATDYQIAAIAVSGRPYLARSYAGSVGATEGADPQYALTWALVAQGFGERYEIGAVQSWRAALSDESVRKAESEAQEILRRIGEERRNRGLDPMTMPGRVDDVD